jgi:zinc protease
LIALVVTDLYKPKLPGAPNQVALQEVKDAILAEVASLRDRPVSDEELLRAKHYAAGSHALKHERLRERAFNLGWMEAIEIGYQFDLEFGSRIDAVTKEDVQRVARKYLTNHAMTVILPKNTPALGSPFSGN